MKKLCNNDFYKIDGIIRTIKSIIYIIAAIGYIIGAFMLYYRLQNFSMLRAKMMKVRLFLSICLVSLPLFLKSIFNILYVIFHWADPLTWDSIENNDLAFPLFTSIYYMITELLPIGAQLISIRIVINNYKDNSLNDNSAVVSYNYNQLGKCVNNFKNKFHYNFIKYS